MVKKLFGDGLQLFLDLIHQSLGIDHNALLT
jgi:hypothetical protein